MLEQVDLSKRLTKNEYKSIVPDLELRLGALQRETRDVNIPVILVFEGWDAAGKGTVINQLLLTCDPRGFVVHPIFDPNEDERLRPFLWRFWTKTPAKGRITVFDHSWYHRVLRDRVEKLVKKTAWERAYEEITAFERQLTDDGTVMIKFFLHISQKEQKKRFRKLEASDITAWKVTDDDWQQQRRYDTYLTAIEDMLAQTDTDYAPWTVIEAHDRRFAIVKVLTTVIQTLEHRLKALKHAQEQRKHTPKFSKPSTESAKSSAESAPVAATPNLSSSILDKVDLTCTLSKEEYEGELKSCQQRIFEIEHEIYKKRIPLIILYQGWDAAGKGGNIRRLTQAMDPRGYEVIPVAAPNDVEKAHHYLWRFWQRFPKAGHIAIFDRSWYERVMVERVEGFCTEPEWRRAYREINDLEAHMTNFGAVLVKFWLHIDADEQLRRFQARQQDPHKQWKITEEDWRNREKWDRYKDAVDEMLFRTSTLSAPWTIIEANSKYYARIKALKTIIEAVEKKL